MLSYVTRSFHHVFLFFFLMIRRPPRSTLFPTRRSSDLVATCGYALSQGRGIRRSRSCTTEEYFRRRKDRKSTRLNSSHSQISYAVFCLKKKNNKNSYMSHHKC